MGRFDLHFHPVFKKTITRFEENYSIKSAAADLLGEIKLSSGVMSAVDDLFIHFLESQCCFEQLRKGGVDLGVAAIAPMERLFTHKGGFAGMLLNSSLTDPLDKRYMERVRDGQWSYYQLLVRELDQYRLLHHAKEIRLLSRKDPKTIDPDHPRTIDPKRGPTPRLALGVEGGHALCRNLIDNTAQPDQVDASLGTDEVWKDFAARPQCSPSESLKLLHAALWREGFDILYLTLTHLSHIRQQPLATHAYGMKLTKAREAYPRGNGISALGLEVVTAAYEMKAVNPAGAGTVDTPVLIDIKHMGLKSRQDLYAFREEKGYGTKVPLLATHMGVTGYSQADWTANLIPGSVRWDADNLVVGFTIDRCVAGRSGLHDHEFNFNGWSLNLLDEDIVQVLRSGGLIGLSLDIRVLGFQGNADVEEFMSSADFRCFFPAEYRTLFGPAGAPEAWRPEEATTSGVKEKRHVLQLCFNLLHILRVAQRAGIKDAWEHICLGSDFDGLIDPVKHCRHSGELKNLEDGLMQWLPTAEEAYGQERGKPQLLPRKPGTHKLDEAQLKARILDFLGGNGERFLKKWINREFK